jgi:3-oxoacyl-(acyl-carrier-protein) synthase
MALWALGQAIEAAGPKDEAGGVIVGLTHGATGFLKEFHDLLFAYGPENVSPNLFSNGVTNATLGALSSLFGLRQGGATVVGFETCGLEALAEAVDSVRNGDYARCFAGAAEEYSSLVEDAYRRCGRRSGVTPPYLPAPGVSGGIGAGRGSVFFGVLPADSAGGQCGEWCWYEPLADVRSCDEAVDLIVAGASGGPRDAGELDALEDILARQKRKPTLLFSKPAVGETFAAGSLWSLAIAWDAVVNQVRYPTAAVHPNLRDVCADRLPPYVTALTLAGARNGDLAGALVRSPRVAGAAHG